MLAPSYAPYSVPIVNVMSAYCRRVYHCIVQRTWSSDIVSTFVLPLSLEHGMHLDSYRIINLVALLDRLSVMECL